jgi:hypothetical protein
MPDDIFRIILNRHSINISDADYTKYQNIFITANDIVNLLAITNKKEQHVAYYTTKSVALSLLIKDDEKNHSQFRQNSIIGTNDPKEGISLIEYFANDYSKHYESQGKSPYQAFIGCFTFNLESLNQFRLYGKTDDREGTGLSLVFKPDFFAEMETAVLASIVSDRENLKVPDVKMQESKADVSIPPKLYRCIYIDPDKKHIVSLGQMDITSFYDGKPDAEAEKEYQKYQKNISTTKKKIQKLFKKIEATINNIEKKNWSLLAELLINLRYLVKHYAFKEEQECRILTVKVLTQADSKIQFQKDGGGEIQRMYIEAGDVSKQIEKIYFGPCAEGMALFQDLLSYEGLDISCEISKLPFADKH